jgi:hypothetical protein
MLSSKSLRTVNEKPFVSSTSRVPDTTAIGDDRVDIGSAAGGIAAGAKIEAWMTKPCTNKKRTSMKKVLARVCCESFNLP